MKKKLKILIISLAILAGIYYVILAPTGWFIIYHKTPSTANEPGIPLNSRTAGSNLIEPKILDFIAFDQKDSIFSNGQRVFRLIGVGGDVIQIKDGIAFRNGENLDKNLELKYLYKLSKEQYAQVIDGKINLNYYDLMRLNDNEGAVYLSNKDNLVKSMNLKRIKDSINAIDPMIQKVYSKPWNKDNFGPLIIPERNYFVLGDNRDGSLDSRFIGLIKKENYVTTIIKF